MVTDIYRHLDLPQGRVAYEVSGHGPPLVLIHAAMVDSRMWDEQVQAFSAEHTVIRYDMLGFGGSDPLLVPLSRRQELLQLLDHLGVTRALLVGCSLGGEIILDLALERPQLVAGLVVVSATPGGFEMQGEPPQELLALFGALEQGDHDLAVELGIRLWLAGSSRRPEEVTLLVRQQFAAMFRHALDKGSWGLTQAPLPDPLDPPVAERLQEIAIPTLVMAGALDHPELLRAALFLAAGIPGAEQVTLPASAHLPNMEEPALFNRAVLDFAARLAEASPLAGPPLSQLQPWQTRQPHRGTPL